MFCLAPGNCSHSSGVACNGEENDTASICVTVENGKRINGKTGWMAKNKANLAGHYIKSDG